MTTQPEYRESSFRSGLKFPPPVSVEEGRAKVADLQDAIAEIQTQLADRNRRHPETGQRMECHEYWEWRRRAVSALSLKNAELRSIKRWLSGQRRESICERCPARLAMAAGGEGRS